MKRDLLLKKQQQERKLLLQQQQQQILHMRLKPENTKDSLLSNGVSTYLYYLSCSEIALYIYAQGSSFLGLWGVSLVD